MMGVHAFLIQFIKVSYSIFIESAINMKTRFVLDRNFSILPELAAYLESGNEIILIDDFLVEAYKSSHPNEILHSNFKIIRNYLNQIFMTFSRVELFRRELSFCKPTEPDQIISPEATLKIRGLLAMDIESLDNQLLALKPLAANHIDFHHAFTEEHIRNTAFEALELLKKQNMLKTFRNDRNMKMNEFKDFSFQLLEKVLAENNPSACDIEAFKQRNSIVFSQIFIHLWRVIHWALNDGFQNATKSIKGDSFDIKYVLISCFFDGILTKEKWLIECREDTISIFSPQTISASMRG